LIEYISSGLGRCGRAATAASAPGTTGAAAGCASTTAPATAACGHFHCRTNASRQGQTVAADLTKPVDHDVLAAEVLRRAKTEGVAFHCCIRNGPRRQGSFDDGTRERFSIELQLHRDWLRHTTALSRRQLSCPPACDHATLRLAVAWCSNQRNA
jgi:hypothetical protein